MNFQSFIEHLVREENLTIEMSYDDKLGIMYNLKTNTYYDIELYETDCFGFEVIGCKISRLHRNTEYRSIDTSPMTPNYERMVKELCKIIKEECMTPLETFCSEQWLRVLNKYA